MQYVHSTNTNHHMETIQAGESGCLLRAITLACSSTGEINGAPITYKQYLLQANTQEVTAVVAALGQSETYPSFLELEAKEGNSFDGAFSNQVGI